MLKYEVTILILVDNPLQLRRLAFKHDDWKSHNPYFSG